MIVELCHITNRPVNSYNPIQYLGAISDYEVAAFCHNTLKALEEGQAPDHIKVSNMLVIQYLRGLLHTQYRHLQPKVQWVIEGQAIDMSPKMTSVGLWKFDVCSLMDEALEMLLEKHSDDMDNKEARLIAPDDSLLSILEELAEAIQRLPFGEHPGLPWCIESFPALDRALKKLKATEKSN